MAIAPSTRYPAQTDPAAGYPHGKARNAVTFNDGTGTPLERDWLNDIWGFLQALLSNASLTPSGTPDAVGASQYLTGVNFAAQVKADAAQAAAIATAATQAATIAAAAVAASEKRLILSNWFSNEAIATVSFLASVAWCSSLGKFIAGSGSDKIVFSSDGGLWTIASGGMGGGVSADGVADNLAGAAVMVGSGGTVKRSTDGNIWTAQTSGTGNSLRGIAWHLDKFIAVGATGTIITSPDGITWTTRTGAPSVLMRAVASNGTNLAVAVGHTGTIITSPDGITWTTRTSGTTQNLSGIAWNGSAWVACGGTALLSSPDGITWTARSSAMPGPAYVAAGAVDGHFVVTGGSSVLACVASADGITWTSLPSGVIGTFTTIPTFVAWNGITAILAGAGSADHVTLRSLSRLNL